MPRESVQEGTTSTMEVDLFDPDGADPGAAPTDVKYRIDNLTNGQQVLADTSLPLSNQAVIAITAAQNAILGGFPREVQRVTLRAQYAAGGQFFGQYDYDIVRTTNPVS